MAPYIHHDLLPRDMFDIQKGHTLTEEIRCYSLPYGGLGFASHILTYYTIVVLSTGRSPIRPWRRLSNSSYDLWLSAISLIGSIAIAGFTLVKCRNHWQLLLIGVWKLSMSFFNGAVGVHISIITKRAPEPAKQRGNKNMSYLLLVDDDEGKASKKTGTRTVEKPSTRHVWFWGILYLPGMIAGFVGLVSLIVQNWAGHHTLHIITYVFSGVLLCIPTLLSCIAYQWQNPWAAPIFWFTAFAALCALYGDWALGAMADNLLGTPSADSAGLFWSYFILKRWTMFSV